MTFKINLDRNVYSEDLEGSGPNICKKGLAQYANLVGPERWDKGSVSMFYTVMILHLLTVLFPGSSSVLHFRNRKFLPVCHCKFADSIKRYFYTIVQILVLQ